MRNCRYWPVAWGAAGLAILLAGCPTVDLGDNPTEIGLCNPAGGAQYFQDRIWPSYVQRPNAMQTCAQVSCHVTGGNGLDFPCPQMGACTVPLDYGTAYKRTQLYLNCGTPAASLFLTKPLAGVDPHQGGDIFPSMSDPSVQVFLDWFK
jgi:hypothetical protein